MEKVEQSLSSFSLLILVNCHPLVMANEDFFKNKIFFFLSFWTSEFVNVFQSVNFLLSLILKLF